MTRQIEEFLNRALNEFRGLMQTCAEAVGFSAKKTSVVGTMLDSKNVENYAKAGQSLESAAQQVQSLAEEGMGLKVNKEKQDAHTPPTRSQS